MFAPSRNMRFFRSHTYVMNYMYNVYIEQQDIINYITSLQIHSNDVRLFNRTKIMFYTDYNTRS